MPFDEGLITLVQVLLHEVGRLAELAAIERFDIEEDRFVFPLAGLLVLLAVVDREAELRDLAAVGEHAHFGVAGQTTDQHDLVEVRHEVVSMSRFVAAIRGVFWKIRRPIASLAFASA